MALLIGQPAPPAQQPVPLPVLPPPVQQAVQPQPNNALAAALATQNGQNGAGVPPQFRGGESLAFLQLLALQRAIEAQRAALANTSQSQVAQAVLAAQQQILAGHQEQPAQSQQPRTALQAAQETAQSIVQRQQQAAAAAAAAGASAPPAASEQQQQAGAAMVVAQQVQKLAARRGRKQQPQPAAVGSPPSSLLAQLQQQVAAQGGNTDKAALLQELAARSPSAEAAPVPGISAGPSSAGGAGPSGGVAAAATSGGGDGHSSEGGAAVSGVAIPAGSSGGGGGPASGGQSRPVVLIQKVKHAAPMLTRKPVQLMSGPARTAAQPGSRSTTPHRAGPASGGAKPPAAARPQQAPKPLPFPVFAPRMKITAQPLPSGSQPAKPAPSGPAAVRPVAAPTVVFEGTVKQLAQQSSRAAGGSLPAAGAAGRPAVAAGHIRQPKGSVVRQVVVSALPPKPATQASEKPAGQLKHVLQSLVVKHHKHQHISKNHLMKSERDAHTAARAPAEAEPAGRSEEPAAGPAADTAEAAEGGGPSQPAAGAGGGNAQGVSSSLAQARAIAAEILARKQREAAQAAAQAAVKSEPASEQADDEPDASGGRSARPSDSGAARRATASGATSPDGDDADGRGGGGRMRIRATVRRDRGSESWRQKVANNLLSFMSKKAGGSSLIPMIPPEAPKHHVPVISRAHWDSNALKALVKGEADTNGLGTQPLEGSQGMVITLIKNTSGGKRTRQGRNAPVPIYSPEPIKRYKVDGRTRRGGYAGRRRGRPRRGEGEAGVEELQGPPGAVATYAPLVGRVKVQLGRMRHEEHLVQTYNADGWKGRR